MHLEQVTSDAALFSAPCELEGYIAPLLLPFDKAPSLSTIHQI